MLTVSLVSALTVGCGGDRSGQRASTANARRVAPAIVDGPGRLVGIGGGRSLFLRCVGSGRTTIVLEAGFGSDTFSWRDVQQQLGRTTQTCAYVLVGHSYGGVLARVSAHLRPMETAGLVLIDTMGRDGRRRQLAIWSESQAPEIRRELATTVTGGVNLAAGEAFASRVRTLGDAPLAVITAGRQDNFPRAPARLAGALNRLWGRMQDELALLSDNSVHVVARRSNHDVPSSHGGQPSVVVGAVEAVVRAARESALLGPCSRIFSGSDVRCRG